MRKREFEPAVHHGFLCKAMPKLEQGVGEQRQRRSISQGRGRGPGRMSEEDATSGAWHHREGTCMH